MPKLPGRVPSLKDFLQRETVLRQYRAFLRATIGLQEPQRTETRRHVRAEYRRHASETDPAQIRTLVVVGQRQLEQLASLVAVAAREPVQQPAEQSADEGWPWASESGRTEARAAQIPKHHDEGGER